MTLPDSPSARSHGSCGPAPQAYSGQLTHGTPPPSCLGSSHIPAPGHSTSLSYLPLSTPRGAAASPQRPGALYPAQAESSITTPLGPPLHITGAAHTGLILPGPTAAGRRGHVTLGSTAHAPQTKTNCGRARAAPSRHATLGHVSGTTARRYLGFRRQQEPRSTCRRADHPGRTT